jgi:chromate transporter
MMQNTVEERQPAPASLAELFLAFTSLALHGFGGVLPWAQRTLVEQRRWLTREEFTELLAFGQLLPGPNIINLSIILGHRYFGWRGSVVAASGLVAVPSMLVVAVGTLYSQFAQFPVVQKSLAGMAAVAAGLVIATALKLAWAQRRRWPWLVFGLAGFIGLGLMRLPLAQVLLVIVPLATALAWWREGKR